MTAIFCDGYWQRVWCDWLDTMQRLEAQGSARLATLETIDCPVLVLHGSKDALIRVEHPKALTAALPRAVMHEIADAGHNVHLSHAAQFNQLVSRFLATL